MKESRPQSKQQLTATRVLQALQQMKVSPDEFMRVYNALPKVYKVKVPTAAEIDAVERFVADGDLKALGARVNRKDHASVSVLVTRVLMYKARGIDAGGSSG